MALVPRQTKAKIKLMWGFTLSRLLGVFFTLFASVLFGNIVHRYLRIPFYIICLALYLFCTRKSPTNPHKTLWQSIVAYWRYFVSPKRYLSVIGLAFNQVLGKEVVLDEGESYQDG